MNFGGDDFTLRNTNVNTPRLQHSNSAQSVTVSAEDYHSVDSSEASTGSSSAQGHDQSLLQPRLLRTPPSRYHTPDEERRSLGTLQSPITVVAASPQPYRLELGSPATVVALSPQTSPRNSTMTIRRKPISPQSPISPTRQASPTEPVQRAYTRPTSTVAPQMAPIRSPAPTLDLDDTPYIHFAIDQLTRDEEVRGSRLYPTSGDPAKQSLLGPMVAAGAAEPPGRRSEAESGPSTTRDTVMVPVEEPRESFEEDADMGIEPDYPVDRYIDDEGLGYIEQERQREAGNIARDKEMAISSAPQHPLATVNHHQRSASSIARNPYDVFVPYTPTVYSHITPKLKFLPGILRPLSLGLYIFICILMLAGLLFSAIWSKSRGGLWAYANFGDNRYFVFQYMPTLFGMIVVLWLFQIQVAVQRISPFIAMASTSTTSRAHASFLNLYPSHFLLPQLQYFKAALPIIGVCSFEFWAFLITVPLLASTYNVRFYGDIGTGEWRWVAVQGVTWTLVALYVIHILTLILLGAFLLRVQSGLKWDPRTLADLIALFERANIMKDYAGSETYDHITQFKQRLWNRSNRLGYWHTSRRPNDTFYGIGEEGGQTRVYSIEQGRIRERAPRGHSAHSSFSSVADIEGQAGDTTGDQAFLADIRDVETRQRHIPRFLTTGAIMLWIALAILLLLAFLVVAFINQATTNGFLPQLSAGADAGGFSAANFLYSFIPALLGLWMFLLWQPLDFAHRRLAPFVNMSKPGGAIAEHSLLLDYPYAYPVSVSVAAISNGDWQVAVLSFMSLVNIAIPILAGGIFWSQWYPGALQVRVAAHPAGLYAICFFLALYAFALFALLPNHRKLSLPHDAKCLSELISWLYMSPLVVDRAFSRCSTRAEMVARLVPAKHRNVNDQGQLRQRKNYLQGITSLLRGRAARPTSHQSLTPGAPAITAETTPIYANETEEQRRFRLSAVPEDHSPPRRQRPTYFSHPSSGAHGEKQTYGFGIYIGRDGKEHLGIDRTIRDGRELILVKKRHSPYGNRDAEKRGPRSDVVSNQRRERSYQWF